MKKEKIAVISRYPPHKCGIGIYTSSYVEAFRKNNCDIKVIAFEGYDYKDKNVFGILKNSSLASYIRAARYIKKINPDKILIEHEYMLYNPVFFPFMLFLLRAKGFKINVTMHTIPEYKNSFVKRCIFKIWNSTFLIFVNNLYVHTKNAKEKISRMTLFHSEKTTIVEIPVSERKVLQKKINSKKINLLCQGFIIEDKSYHLVIESFGSHRGYNVKIAGSVQEGSMQKQFDYMKRLKNMAEKHDNIEIIDKYISEKEKDSMMKWADFIMLPYSNLEQSANLTTAWSFEKIPVCSDLIPFKEEIENNKYGVLFRNSNANDMLRKVESVKSNKKIIAKIKSNIKKLKFERSFRKMADKFMKTML